MECLKTFLVLLLLFVTKCAIAEEQACHAGNCTDGTSQTNRVVHLTLHDPVVFPMILPNGRLWATVGFFHLNFKRAREKCGVPNHAFYC